MPHSFIEYCFVLTKHNHYCLNSNQSNVEDLLIFLTHVKD